MINEQVLREIDSVIKLVWEKDIKKDHRKNYLLREDTLKASIYFHLRRRLKKLLKENSLRIYTEFYLSKIKLRPDIVIAEIDEKSEEWHLKDWVVSIPVIIEIKFESGKSKGTKDVIKRDIEKMKTYIKDVSPDSKCYLAVLYEDDCAKLTWMNKCATNNWANGKVTELNAGYLDGKLVFEANPCIKVELNQ